MKNITKQKMIYFINTKCTYKGKKLSKKALNKLTTTQLMQIISSSSKIEEGFKAYLEEISSLNHASKNRPKLNNKKKDYLTEMKHHIRQVLGEPTSFLAISNFKNFIDTLPFNSIKTEDLQKLADQLMESNPHASLILYNYLLNQTIESLSD